MTHVYFYLFIGLVNIVLGEKYCMVTMTEVICRGFDARNLADNSDLTITNTDIRKLDLSGTFINTLNKTVLGQYKNLEELSLTKCQITAIENEALYDLYRLVKVNLSDNFMKTFNSKSFNSYNIIRVLILSNNLLDTLDSFDFKSFPKLTALDISGNRLKYLSSAVITKLGESDNFNLFADNNPWDCKNPKWTLHLAMDPKLNQSFCKNKTETVLSKLRKGFHIPVDTVGNYVSKSREVCDPCNFVRCLYWILGSVWVGVIIGNLNRLNNLLYMVHICKHPARFCEKSIGTEVEHLPKIIYGPAPV